LRARRVGDWGCAVGSWGRLRGMRLGRGCGPFGEQTYLCRPPGYREAPRVAFLGATGRAALRAVLSAVARLVWAGFAGEKGWRLGLRGGELGTSAGYAIRTGLRSVRRTDLPVPPTWISGGAASCFFGRYRQSGSPSRDHLRIRQFVEGETSLDSQAARCAPCAHVL